MKQRLFSLIAVACIFPVVAFSQIKIVENGKPAGRIVVGGNAPASVSALLGEDGEHRVSAIFVYGEDEREAAELMADFAKRLSGAELEILDSAPKTRKGDIVFLGTSETSGLTEDAFCLLYTSDAADD